MKILMSNSLLMKIYTSWVFFNMFQYIDLSAEKGMKSQQKEKKTLGSKFVCI